MRIIMLATQNNLIKNINYYQFKNFLECGALACFNNRNLDLGFGSSKIEENRKEFLSTLGINHKDLVCCQQPHGGKVAIVEESDKGKGAYSFAKAIAECDALVTNCKNIPLAVLTADCLPLFLFARKKSVSAIIHAGWRGIKENILENTVFLMRDKFGVYPQDLLVGLGPAIRGCCYEVKEEFKDYFPGEVLERNGRLYLDLIGINLGKLLNIGVIKENIFDSGFCTACLNEKFFSFRKEGPAAGRLMSVIMLR